jgi:hypothetical protein
MICSSVNLFFTSNLLLHGIGLQSQPLLKSGETSANHKVLFEAAAVHWAAGEPLTVREIIYQSALGSPATLHKRLQSLIAQDFLKAESETADRRTKYISPTPKGLKYAHWLGDKLLKSTMANAK